MDEREASECVCRRLMVVLIELPNGDLVKYPYLANGCQNQGRTREKRTKLKRTEHKRNAMKLKVNACKRQNVY